MISPIVAQIWHASAYTEIGDVESVETQGLARHCFLAGHRRSRLGLRSKWRIPSPSLRSGPSLAGPTLCPGQAVACCADGMKNCLEMRDVAVESAAITTTIRGSSPCGNRLSSLPFCPPRLPVACRTPRRAVWLVRRPGLSSPTPRKAMSLPARLSAGWRALQPAASSWACRPATRATDRLNDRAFGRAEPLSRTIRASRPGGPFSLRLWGDADV